MINRKTLLFLGLLMTVGIQLSIAGADTVTKRSATKLISELGCPACHSGLDDVVPSPFPAPDLSHAGLRYRSAYLFDYLLRPRDVRRNDGLARMPDFHFTEEESLALTLFLSAQRATPEGWPWLEGLVASGVRAENPDTGADEKITSLGCTQCHSWKGEGGELALDLGEAGVRLQRRWIANYLADPARAVPAVAMPALFYSRHTESGNYLPQRPEATADMETLMQALQVEAQAPRLLLEKRFQEVRGRFPQATAELGERIFVANNCTACHPLGQRRLQQGRLLDLGFEGTRVQRQWLVSYLRRPGVVRPSGFPPGSGSRMPDFRLSEDEVEVLSDFLMERTAEIPATADTHLPLSRFAINKGRRFVTEKAACLGCHQLGPEGGRIAPDLAAVPGRLQPDYVFSIIEDPQRWMPDTLMPGSRLTPQKLKLVGGFLLHQNLFPVPGSDAVSKQGSPISSSEEGEWESPGEAVYHRYCSHCHGPTGAGNGWNASYLPTPPTDFTDSESMSQRPDDTLFDGVFAGGAILNKSHRMPAWGQTLSRRQIWDVITYLRRLCACEGPTWSRDDL